MAVCWCERLGKLELRFNERQPTRKRGVAVQPLQRNHGFATLNDAVKNTILSRQNVSKLNFHIVNACYEKISILSMAC